MDIHMDPLDGLETARVLREKCMTVFLVFMTAGEDQYPAAFSVRAFDYIQKPVEEAQIRRILEDVIRIKKEPEPFFHVPQAGNIKIPYSDIRYICSDRNYMMLSVSRGNDRRFRMTFKSAAGQLQEDPRFLIINRGILVNMEHIRNMTNPSCFMDDGAVFPVNRRKAASLQQTYKKWQLSSRSNDTSNM
jgi:DNA-binding LytR/AlgR family response regulator